MKATHLKLYSLKLSFENKLYFLSTEINTCLLSNIGMNHQHRPKCYTEYISLLTISSVNKQEYRWLTDAICREQTLIQIYKCKCTVSWHRMSNHTSGKQLWESKIFLSVGVTKIPPPPNARLIGHLHTAKSKKQSCASFVECRSVRNCENHHWGELQIWHKTYNSLRNSREM